MIPKNVHFIFGLSPDLSKRRFTYAHYLAVLTAKKIIKPEEVNIYYAFEPHGEWWEKIKGAVTLNMVEAPKAIFGNPLTSYQHKADVIRLDVLREHGGIYLDIDVLTLNSFDDLITYRNVMGVEPSVGLCNAVILAEENSEFLNAWYNSYKSFNSEKWNYHSIQLPLKIAKTMENLVHIESYYSFYYPFYKDTAFYYLWGVKPNHKKMYLTFIKNLIIKAYSILPFYNIKYFPILHQFKSLGWHFAKMDKSYCIHLWETLWGNKYLSCLGPENVINSNDSFFNRLVSKRLTRNEIIGNV